MINTSEILATKKPKVGNILFIAVDGHGGSGKSRFAEWLADKLQATVIHTDDFASWDNPLNWWPLIIERVFKPIAAGAEKINYPLSQWWDGHQRGLIVDQSATKITILEGVSSLRREFRDYISLGFFVDTPKEVCLQRGIQRDLKYGKTHEELKQEWTKGFEEELRYMERDNPKDYADIVIDVTRPFEEQIEI